MQHAVNNQQAVNCVAPMSGSCVIVPGMNRDFLPWKVYSPLTQQRLSIVGNLLREARHGTVELYDPLNGDTPWSHGCRAYVRQIHAIREGAKRYTWLTILPDEEALRFTFAIGGIPIRFYRGAPDEAPERYLQKTFAEIRQLQLVLIEGLRIPSKVLRMSIETDAEGEVAEINVVELDKAGQPLSTYLIPAVALGDNVVPAETRAIELPPLLPEPIKKTEAGNEKKAQAKKTNG
jgi:hypothetical protein